MTDKEKERDEHLDALGRNKYPEVWDTLTDQQRALAKDSLHDTLNDRRGRYCESTIQHVESDISIFKSSGKQEPDCKKMYYGENGEPVFIEEKEKDFRLKLGSREDIVRECIKSNGNLNQLLNEFKLEDARTYQGQILTTFCNLIIDSKNPKLEMQAMLEKAGMEMKDSGEKTARKYGITRQALSKKKQTIAAKLGLPRETRDSKKVQSRTEYVDSNHRPYKP